MMATATRRSPTAARPLLPFGKEVFTMGEIFAIFLFIALMAGLVLANLTGLKRQAQSESEQAARDETDRGNEAA